MSIQWKRPPSPLRGTWISTDTRSSGTEFDPEAAERFGNDAEFVVPRGGPLRVYRPLDDEGLWLRFAQTCEDAAGVLRFANQFGQLGEASLALGKRIETVHNILGLAALIRSIVKHLQEDNRLEATKLFNRYLPNMKEGILWYKDEPERFHYRLLPLSLRDALLHQAGDAITGNRRFRRCRNEGCANWFRLGPSAVDEGHPRQTITARREFCSDRCRVASARRQKRKGAAHA